MKFEMTTSWQIFGIAILFGDVGDGEIYIILPFIGISITW